jgi:hypothetical protein
MAEKKQVIKTLEMHTGGEPLRIVLSGRKMSYNLLKPFNNTVYYCRVAENVYNLDICQIFNSCIKDHLLPVYNIPGLFFCTGYPPVVGASILEKRRYVRSNLDHLRKMLMYEPRGHMDMYGALLIEKDLEEADMAVLFMHNEGEIVFILCNVDVNSYSRSVGLDQ